jgi:hypothetical protein
MIFLSVITTTSNCIPLEVVDRQSADDRSSTSNKLLHALTNNTKKGEFAGFLIRVKNI